MTQNKFTPPEQKCSDSKKGGRIVLVSFADSRYANALKRLERYTERFPFTERHFHTEKNTFTKKYWKELKPWLYRRGYGYWEWKGRLVREYLEGMEEGDIIVWSDAGICWNDAPAALKRFSEYLSMLKDGNDIIAFQEPYPEEEWTKGDLLAACDAYYDEKICKSLQLWGGVFIIKKSVDSMRFIYQWTSINEISKELITDLESGTPNKPGFKEHRHDQSSFSVLVKQMPHIEISHSETNAPSGDWTKMVGFPIWAKRTKEQGRPFSVRMRNKLLRPWRMLLGFYFRRVRHYHFLNQHYPW